MNRYVLAEATFRPGTVTSGTDFTWTFTSGTTIENVLLRKWLQPGNRINDAVNLVEARLLCNFADGFVYKAQVEPDPLGYPGCSVWMGDTVNADPLQTPADFVNIAFPTLNEWYAVNMPLPRYNPQLSGAFRGVFAGNTKWLTNSVNPDFDGSLVKFSFQFRLQTAIW